MSQYHTIRLHGPWNAQVLEGDNVSGDGYDSHRRVTFPPDFLEWPGASFRGRIEYQRSFHLPTRLEDDQRVFLVIAWTGYRLSCFLNDELLGEWDDDNPSQRVEVRKRLRPSNVIRIVIEFPGVGAWGGTDIRVDGIQLEIEEG